MASCQTDAWQASLSELAQLDSFRAQALALLDNAAGFHSINEASTEQELIRPLLELLGWGELLPQQGSDSNEDIPDFLLFGDAESKAHASAKPRPDRYVDALAVAESKRFGAPLDARDKEEQGKPGSPHAQILRYLATADINSDGRIRWGILTNGRTWRLYDRRARPRASGYYEADLEAAARADDGRAIGTFRLLFGRASFSPQAAARRPASLKTPSPKACATKNRSQTISPAPSSKRSTRPWCARSPTAAAQSWRKCGRPP